MKTLENSFDKTKEAKKRNRALTINFNGAVSVSDPKTYLENSPKLKIMIDRCRMIPGG